MAMEGEQISRMRARVAGLAAAAVVAIGLSVVAASLAGASLSASSSVVGGKTTTTAKWPWQAAIAIDQRFGGNAFDRQFCGAALIHPSIVITAAHCIFQNDPDGYPPPLTQCAPADPDIVADPNGCHPDPDDFDVILGRTRLSTSAGVVHDITGAYVHPDYDPGDSNEFDDDVAFLSLASPSSLKRIKIAAAGERALWTPGRRAFVTGWGLTSDGGAPSDTLREAEIGVIGDPTCDSAYSEFDAVVMVCAGVLAGGKDSCNGDSGGPLSSPTAAGGFRLTGLVSFGGPCAAPNLPGVYSRVAGAELRDYIKAAVAQIEAEQGLPTRNVVGDGTAQPPTSVRCSGIRATRLGTAGNDVINGTPGRDIIVGRGGDDIIRGRGGNDVICGKNGRDVLRGGPGRDRLIGQKGDDRLLGENGADVLLGGPGSDGLFGGPGGDSLFGNGAFDRLRGGPGGDLLVGGAARDSCKGGPGRDRARRC